jgi:hypothetical protein
VKHLLFIVARVEYLRHNVQLLIIVLGRSDVEFLILIESQACCLQGLQLLRESILHDEHGVGLHTRDAAQALPLHLQLGRNALAVFRDQNVVAHLEVRRPHVRLVVVFLNSSLAIMRSSL